MRRRTTRWVATVAALALLGACSAGASPVDDAADAPTGPRDARPNVVVVITDDQTLEMMVAMRATQSLVGGAGVTFSNANVALPLCCPTRATLLTGQYPHSHGVRDNLAPDGGFTVLDWDHTIAVTLQEAGYRTAHVGRTLNDYTIDARPLVPPGWDEWYTPLEDSTRSFISRGATMVANGELVSLSSVVHTDDALGAVALDIVDSWADGSEPFYMEIGTQAPHTSRPGLGTPGAIPVAADRHTGDYAGTRVPEVAEDGPGKPAWVAGQQDRVSADVVQRYWEGALESLEAVDEMMESLVGRLDRAGVLDDTLIFFTSDNGMLLGEHGIALQKVLPYQPAVNIPLLVRGPGFAAGTTSDLPVSHVDIAPTIMVAAGLDVPDTMEGVPLQESLADPERAERRALLVESTPTSRPSPPFSSVRSGDLFLTRYVNGAAELSDLSVDPEQLQNVIDDPAYADDVAALDGLLERLSSCRGAGCVVYDDEARP